MISSYVALDLETTGLNPARDRIIEIGMARVKDGQITDTYSQLIYPGMRISERIEQLTGITDQMLCGKPLISDVIANILDFIGEEPILGHNIIFDYSFLKKAAVNAGKTISGMGIDTLRIARRVVPEVEHKKLDYLCAHFGINPGQSHRALDDAISASLLYGRLHEIKPEDSGFAQSMELVYAVKKDSPITDAQKKYLAALLAHNDLELDMDIELLSKSDASRKIDQIISEYGKWT